MVSAYLTTDPLQAPKSVYVENGEKADKSLKYWISPASLTTDAKQDEILNCLINLILCHLMIVSMERQKLMISGEAILKILLGRATVVWLWN